MANVPPGQPIAPGIATGKFPEWGVGGGTPGSSAGWNIKEAANAQQQEALIQQGYVAWFSTKQAAQNFISEESSTLGSGTVPGLSGLAAIGAFFSKLTEPLMWLRAAEVVVGAVLLIVGIGKMAGMGHDVMSIAKTAIKGAALA